MDRPQYDASMFRNSQVAVFGGTFNMNNQMTLDQTATNEVYTNTQLLELLRERCSLSALVDAKERFNAPRCAESTRRRILRRTEDWISKLNHGTIPASLFWLSGGAGAGKSALAQTLADEFQKNEKLAASFFFFKAEASRNNGDHLIPTLVYQLAKTFNGISSFIEGKLHTNPDLFTKNRQTQAVDLLLEPLVRLSIQDFDRLKMLEARPQLIVIDGLDECQDPDIQCDLLRIIACIIRHLPYPFRFLITSRPETHILKTFERDPDLQVIKVYRYNLSQDPDADNDIYEFLEQGFQAIHLDHPLGHSLPSTWPDQKVITMLVENSSGHFIYASTVVRYLKSHQNDPRDRLDVILGLKRHRETDRPYSQLDELFKLILQGVDSVRLKEVLCAFGVIHLRSQRRGGLFEDYWSSDHVAIKDLFGIHPVLLFNPLLSVVAIENETAEHVVIRILHKSLLDYLLDFTRSGNLRINFDFVHEASANYVLKKIREENCTPHEFRCFAYHCQFAHLTATSTLKRYLTDTCLEVPTQQHLSNNYSWKHPGKSLPLSIFYMFRTLSRKNFDSSQHKQYAQKIQEHFQLSVKWYQRAQSIISESGLVGTNPRYREVELQSTLRGWQPRDLDYPTRKEDRQKSDRVARINRELSILRSYIQFSYLADKTISALITSKYFIHNYHYAIQHGASVRIKFLIFFTYSKNNDMVGWSTFGPNDLAPIEGDAEKVILRCAQNHLKHTEEKFRASTTCFS